MLVTGSPGSFGSWIYTKSRGGPAHWYSWCARKPKATSTASSSAAPRGSASTGPPRMRVMLLQPPDRSGKKPKGFTNCTYNPCQYPLPSPALYFPSRRLQGSQSDLTRRPQFIRQCLQRTHDVLGWISQTMNKTIVWYGMAGLVWIAEKGDGFDTTRQHQILGSSRCVHSSHEP